ncbi:MAG: amidase [Pseudomonadota bacterium]
MSGTEASTDKAFLSALEIASGIRTGAFSASEMLEHYFDRIDRFDGDINAVVVQQRDEARAAAAAADAAVARGDELGPLHGVPTTVKESYNLAGTPTTWGNPDWRENVPSEDAESVKRLKEAGAVIFGKTNVPLMLADFQSYNDVYGTTNNPYDLTRNAGGSSGGSAAALAAGLTGLETGSDIGGSIRNPAHFCGVFGHKPTWNLLWMRGHAPPGDSRSTPDISVIGPLARSAADLEVTTKLMAGPDPIASRGLKLDLPALPATGLKGLKVAVWAEDDHCPISNDVRNALTRVAAALRDAGAQLNEEARPGFTTEASHRTYQTLLQATLASRMPDQEYDGLKAYVATLDADDDSESARTLRAQLATFKDWTATNDHRNHLRWHWHEFFKDFDLVLMPIMPRAAFPHDHRKMGERTIMIDNIERPYFDQVFWAGLTGVSFLPSTVIPTGLNGEGLPIGVQIVGPEYGDLKTIGAAKLLEAQGFAFEAPPNYS